MINLFLKDGRVCNVDVSKLVMPMDTLDRGFKKFQKKFNRDSEYLKAFAF